MKLATYVAIFLALTWWTRTLPESGRVLVFMLVLTALAVEAAARPKL